MFALRRYGQESLAHGGTRRNGDQPFFAQQLQTAREGGAVNQKNIAEGADANGLALGYAHENCKLRGTNSGFLQGQVIQPRDRSGSATEIEGGAVSGSG